MKNTLKILSAISSVVISLSLAACAKSAPDIEEVPDSKELIAYVQTISDEELASGQNKKCTLSVGVKGRSMVFSYTYTSKEACPNKSDVVENLDSLNKEMLAQLKAVREESGCEIDSIIVEYLDVDGKELASKEYKD